MVNSTAMIDRTYFDEVSKKDITVNISVIDALLLDYLRKIEVAIRSLK